MGIGENVRKQLAAAALKRQLDRVSDNAQRLNGSNAPGTTLQGDTDAPDRDEAPWHARTRFEAMPLYQQVSLVRRMGHALQVESPFFRLHEGAAGATTIIGGREYLNFASYNYLGLSTDPVVIASAKDALDRYGTSSSASRMVAGERPVHRELERALAQVYGTDDCVAFVSGHATNVTVIGALFGHGDLVIHDSLAHNSIVQGAQLSGARRLSFAHNDWRDLDTILSRTRHEFRNVLVVIEGLYSMDGDSPALEHFVELRTRHGVFLMVDEAHSFGVLGGRGKGIAEHCGVIADDVDLWMGTMSKSLAGCGGFVAGCQPLIDMLRHLAPGFLYSVGMSPVLAAASLAALNRMLEAPERVQTLRARGQQFLHEARAAGFDTGLSEGHAIVPIITGSSLKAAQWANALFDAGINVQPIFYPAVEERAARLRFFICSTHEPSQISRSVATLAAIAAS